MHRARVVFTLTTEMDEDAMEQWTDELMREAKRHLTEGESVELDTWEVAAERFSTILPDLD